MKRRKAGEVILSLVIAGLLTALAATQARAVPSFARQTGQDCYRCHTMFPELTPTGRVFKMTGYVINKTMSKCPPYPPVSAMVLTRTRTLTARSRRVLLHRISGPFTLYLLTTVMMSSARPSNLQCFTQVRFTIRLGPSFRGLTWTLRIKCPWTTLIFVMQTVPRCAGTKTSYSGLPSTTTQPWKMYGTRLRRSAFPTPHQFSPRYAASALITGLGAQVGGIGVYAYWDNLIYAAASVYRTSENGITLPFGSGNHPLGATGGRRPALLAYRPCPSVWCPLFRDRHLRAVRPIHLSALSEAHLRTILQISLLTRNISTALTSTPFQCRRPGFMKTRVAPAASPQAPLQIRLIRSTRSKSMGITTTGPINVELLADLWGFSRQREPMIVNCMLQPRFLGVSAGSGQQRRHSGTGLLCALEIRLYQIQLAVYHLQPV